MKFLLQKTKRISVRLPYRLLAVAAAVLMNITNAAAAFKSGHLHSKIMTKRMVSINFKIIISDAKDSLEILGSEKPGN